MPQPTVVCSLQSTGVTTHVLMFKLFSRVGASMGNGELGTTCCHLQRACRGRWAFVSTGSSSQAWLLPGSPNTRERTRSSAVARVLEPKPLVDHRWRLERYKGRLDPWLPTPPVAKIRDQAACPIRSHPRPLLAPVIEFLIGQLLLVLPSSRALSLAIQSNATNPCQRFCHALGPQSHQQFLCSPRCTSHRGTPVSSSFSASKASKDLAPCFLGLQGGKETPVSHCKRFWPSNF